MSSNRQSGCQSGWISSIYYAQACARRYFLRRADISFDNLQCNDIGFERCWHWLWYFNVCRPRKHKGINSHCWHRLRKVTTGFELANNIVRCARLPTSHTQIGYLYRRHILAWFEIALFLHKRSNHYRRACVF